MSKPDPADRGRLPPEPSFTPSPRTRPLRARIIPRSGEFPSLPASPSPQLPDFKPRGMSNIDRICAWIVVFVLLAFGIVVAAHYLLKPAAATVKPHTSTSAAAHSHKT